jgi:MoxR-like ATPase
LLFEDDFFNHIIGYYSEEEKYFTTDQERPTDQKNKKPTPVNKLLRAESLAEGNYRRDKFWPERH